MNFGELRAWLKALPDQGDGDPYAVCQTGEPYVAFLRHALARPEDVQAIERVVGADMHEDLLRYFDGKSGRIY